MDCGCCGGRAFRGCGKNTVTEPANLNPDVVAAPRSYHREPLVPGRRCGRELRLDRAELVQRVLRILGKEVVEKISHRREAERSGRERGRSAGADDRWLFAHVHHQRVSVSLDDGRNQGVDDLHTLLHRTFGRRRTVH
jgi:hypothetical protein